MSFPLCYGFEEATSYTSNESYSSDSGAFLVMMASPDQRRAEDMCEVTPAVWAVSLRLLAAIIFVMVGGALGELPFFPIR